MPCASSTGSRHAHAKPVQQLTEQLYRQHAIKPMIRIIGDASICMQLEQFENAYLCRQLQPRLCYLVLEAHAGIAKYMLHRPSRHERMQFVM
eukprot:5607681-Pleurochrysis_carterae.AAC.2